MGLSQSANACSSIKTDSENQPDDDLSVSIRQIDDVDVLDVASLVRL